MNFANPLLHKMSFVLRSSLSLFKKRDEGGVKEENLGGIWDVDGSFFSFSVLETGDHEERRERKKERV